MLSATQSPAGQPLDVARVVAAFNSAMRSLKTLSFEVDGSYASRQPGQARQVHHSHLRAFVQKNGGKFRYALDDNATVLLGDGKYVYEVQSFYKPLVVRTPRSSGKIATEWNAPASCPAGVRLFTALVSGAWTQGLADFPDPQEMTARSGMVGREPVDIVTQTTRYENRDGGPPENDVWEVCFSRRTHLPLRVTEWFGGKSGAIPKEPKDLETFKSYKFDRPIPPATFVFLQKPGTRFASSADEAVAMHTGDKTRR